MEIRDQVLAAMGAWGGAELDDDRTLMVLLHVGVPAPPIVAR